VTSWKNTFRWRGKADPVGALQDRLERFRELVNQNNQVLELIADAGEKLGGEYIFDIQYLRTFAQELEAAVRGVISNLNAVTGNRYPKLLENLETISADIQAVVEARGVVPKASLVIPLEEVGEEISQVVGQKMARLGEISDKGCCRVPDGFVVSTYACQRFLETAGIEATIREWFDRQGPIDDAMIAERSAQLQDRIRRADLPKDLARAIRRKVARLKKSGSCPALAVRSSAIGEDGELSFAGQYQTILGVVPDQVPAAYKEVVASLYSSGVMKYRRSGGLHPASGSMAVGCHRMIEARSGGVLYTLDPSEPEKDVLVVASTWGLGKTVVDGGGAVDRFEISRHAPHPVLSRSVVRKKEKYVVEPARGIKKVAVAESEDDSSTLTDAQLEELAATALRIEKYMKCVQDIEWAVDAEGRLFILQTRPLRIDAPRSAANLGIEELMNKYPVLMRNRGEVACRGIGSGRVHVVTDEDDFDTLPDDVVLVARSSTPRLAAAMVRANAVLTDVGTATGHLAAIAREFRVPTILDTEVATQVLGDAGEVTVDAEENVVYGERVGELVHYQLLRRSAYEETAEFRLLRRMLKKIAPLNLNDPQSPDFVVEKCATYHDIIRFAHEKAVEQLTEGHWVRPSKGSPYVRRLDLEIPLDLIIIDLGGGLRTGEATRTAKMEDVTSAPLLALVDGLTTEGVWATGPADMDLDGFMSSATRAVSLTALPGTRPQQNLAIVSDRYLNLNLKLGYHFNIVDCYLTETRNDNFIYFRFAGGVTGIDRRSRRAALLKRILERHDFVVEGKGDLVIARIKKISLETMVQRLEMIGRLIGFTRQLDIYLKDDSLVERCVERFMRGESNAFNC
jgi:pyruvate,water dikinase